MSRVPAVHFARAAVCAGLLALPAASRAGPVEDAIQARMERLSEEGSLAIGSAVVAATALLPQLYELRGYRPAWDQEDRIDRAIRAIEDAALDGLVPSDYHYSELLSGREALDADSARSAGELADLDILATDAVVRLAYHLYVGKVDPTRLDSKWNFTRTLDREAAVEVLGRTMESGEVENLMDRVRPTHPLYADLRKELSRHRDLAARGGWPVIPPGPTLAVGGRDPRVPLLRQRLAASGDLAGPDRANGRDSGTDTSLVFDASLETAVREFQGRHLLGADGAVGPGTLAALNVPVRDRIHQIRVNLERGRWLLHELPDSFIVVNVAAYETYLNVGGRRVWSARCQVGKQARQTPIFRDELRYVVLNPTWTVPSGILSRDILPPLQRGDLGVLRRKKLKVIDREGRVVSPASVRWSKISARSCPYTFRQDPGPDNALGRVKFMFPNAYSVYLHDTPSKDLFEEPSRAFSSGCIRVDRPLELAERVLADPKWDAAAIRRTLESGTTTTVNLRRPLPVLLLYWTAYCAGEDRRVVFASDIYGRDEGILEALEGPVRTRTAAKAKA